MGSLMIKAIAAHRAAWQAFQDAPEDANHDDTICASDHECTMLGELLQAVPVDQEDLLALKSHLDWWVVEEAQRRDGEPEPFMLHAVITLAMSPGAPA